MKRRRFALDDRRRRDRRIPKGADAATPRSSSPRAVVPTGLAAALLILTAAAGGAVEPNSDLRNRLTLQGGPDQPTKEYKNIAGKPCLQFEALAVNKLTDNTRYEHIVGMNNICLQKIDVHICYVDSDQCIDAEVPGLERKEIILDFSARTQFFAYTYSEK